MHAIYAHFFDRRFPGDATPGRTPSAMMARPPPSCPNPRSALRRPCPRAQRRRCRQAGVPAAWLRRGVPSGGQHAGADGRTLAAPAGLQRAATQPATQPAQESCWFHPGAPIFMDGSKEWSCCGPSVRQSVRRAPRPQRPPQRRAAPAASAAAPASHAPTRLREKPGLLAAQAPPRPRSPPSQRCQGASSPRTRRRRRARRRPAAGARGAGRSGALRADAAALSFGRRRRTRETRWTIGKAGSAQPRGGGSTTLRASWTGSRSGWATPRTTTCDLEGAAPGVAVRLFFCGGV